MKSPYYLILKSVHIREARRFVTYAPQVLAALAAAIWQERATARFHGQRPWLTVSAAKRPHTTTLLDLLIYIFCLCILNCF
jgi:type VI protein secretion system component VasF